MVKFVYDIKDGDEVVAEYGDVELYPVVFNKQERNFLVNWLRFVGEQIVEYRDEDSDLNIALLNDILDQLEDKGDFEI